MSIARHHAEWLSLVPVSGPFLSLPVLMEAFPQGLDAHDAEHARLLRLAYEEWRVACDEWWEGQKARRGTASDPRTTHHEWIKFVLTNTLEFDESLLAEGQAIPQTLQVEVAEHGELLKPNIVLMSPPGSRSPNPDSRPSSLAPRLLIQTYPRSQDLTSYVAGSRWKASPETRMTELLHGTGVRLGLVTNGEHWMLVDAPKGETTGYASWCASLWLEEKITLQAFRSLLSMTRFFGVSDDETIEALLTKSASNQQEVTDQLGLQVRKAVEVLVQSLDKADQDHGRELLEGVSEAVLYESALTVMMRLVFLFCAEERELIPTKPFPVYEQNYSVSMISKQLREIADQHGEELLERRYDAWPRLLAAFRAVYGGLAHDDVYMPAYGGRLFDPDRFPFLEGRKPKTTWRVVGGAWSDSSSPTTHHAPRPTFAEASPLPVNNRTVLHLLEALQLLQVKVPGGGPAEARRLSFRALDIEQIGHVYEGLLDHTAKRATEPTLGLIGKKEPEIPLQLLEQEREKGDQSFFDFLKKETGSSRKWQNYLDVQLDDRQERRLRTACGNDDSLLLRVKPFAGLLREDTFGYPVVIPKGSVFVTAGTDRRSSGTHYTPRSLTEPIVQYTLEPLVYVGPAEGKPKSEWKLKSAAELLDLKICDMACGSGAFLVQAARYMSERLLEAWSVEGEAWSEEEIVQRAENIVEGQNDGGSELSGAGSLAGGDAVGRGMLQADSELPEGRTLRDDLAGQESRCVNPGEHSGGSRKTIDKGVHELPERCTGVAEGSGNSSDLVQPGRVDGGSATRAAARSDGPNQPDARQSAQSTGKETLTPHAPRSTHHASPRITPEGLPATGAINEQLVPDDPHERRIYAMRLITQRCLYGVDVNPLAAEMAKLSLWLLTLAKDKPFEFLDHAIRCGDSLVGLHDLEQLRHFSLKPDADDAVLFKGPLDNAVDEAINLRLKLEDMPANTVEDVEAQEKLLREAEDKIARLRCAADLLVAAEFWGEGTQDKQERVRHAAVVAGHYVEHGPTEEFEQKAKKERRGQRMFHWPLEFPEVIVNRGGFDAFVGNPPFLGGMRISPTLGYEYTAYVKQHWDHGKGHADLVTFFLLRAAEVTKASGFVGMIATKSICEGDTREIGLGHLVACAHTLFRATTSTSWPGTAGVYVSTVYFTRKKWKGPMVLDDIIVPRITSRLDAEEELHPKQLSAMKGLISKGTGLVGIGFVVDKPTYESLLEIDPRNAEVLFRYLNAQEFNQNADQAPTRWVINFRDWSKDQAAAYAEPFRIVTELVKPVRDNITKQIHEKNYWLFWDKRKRLYEKMAGLQEVLIAPVVTKYVNFAFVPTGWIYSNELYVIPNDSRSFFSCVQSTFHADWVIRNTSKLGSTIRYTTTDSFQTFPLCDLNSVELAKCGTRYHDFRKEVMLGRTLGLTDMYNRFHEPDESSADIQTLRDLHVEMDYAVATAYGWDDLDLGHGFHETKQGIRFTISEPARREVLQRLLKLNHERYAEEVKQGLHKKKGRGARGERRGKRTRKKKTAAGPTLPGFGDDEEGG